MLVCAECHEPFTYHDTACPKCGNDSWEPDDGTDQEHELGKARCPQCNERS